MATSTPSSTLPFHYVWGMSLDLVDAGAAAVYFQPQACSTADRRAHFVAWARAAHGVSEFEASLAADWLAFVHCGTVARATPAAWVLARVGCPYDPAIAEAMHSVTAMELVEQWQLTGTAVEFLGADLDGKVDQWVCRAAAEVCPREAWYLDGGRDAAFDAHALASVALGPMARPTLQDLEAAEHLMNPGSCLSWDSRRYLLEIGTPVGGSTPVDGSVAGSGQTVPDCAFAGCAAPCALTV